ncbi:hypothetical protein KP509_37G068900 [Ceratopteris richardii]|uniref:Uncharacterized protein n=1 Tax=Ceratopteris richardii TaxID=49495 RepID=A0A8T2Q9N8_CERRI|nr:hypothetical protein KP509_37G068900 [Ceratopteris richardii]
MAGEPRLASYRGCGCWVECSKYSMEGALDCCCIEEDGHHRRCSSCLRGCCTYSVCWAVLRAPCTACDFSTDVSAAVVVMAGRARPRRHRTPIDSAVQRKD